MTKVTTFLSRKPADAAAKNGAALMAATAKNGADAAVPSHDEIATKVGKEHEALRTMLADAARRIGSLDLVKEAYDKLAEPIVKTMQALEHEKVHNAALQTMLTGLTASHEKNRAELHATKQRNAALESAHGKLREDLERAQEQVRIVEAMRLKLAGEATTKRDRITALERHLAQETAERQRLGDERKALTLQLAEAEKRIVQIEADAAAGREKGVLADAELRGLRKSLDETIAESGRIARRLTESENNLAAANTQMAKLGTAVSAVTSERDRLANALDDANGRHQSEIHSLNVRLEALGARAQAAEKLLAEVRQSLAARTEEARDFDRKHVEATIALNASEKKVEEIETAMASLEATLHESEQAHAAMTERNAGLARNLRERELALGRAEEYLQTLTDRIAHLECEMEAGQTAYEKRIDELNATLQRERMERSMIDGALETARRDYAMLHRDYTALHAGVASGAQVAVG